MSIEYAQSWPHVGATYEHYKGGRYVVIAIAEHHETREKLVVYRPVDSEILSVRPLYGSKADPDGWVIPVREGVPRFKAAVDVRPISDYEGR